MDYINKVKSKLSIAITVPPTTSTTDFSTLVGKVLEWVLNVAASIALLMLITGGIMYVTSTGDEQKIANSKKIITWTILGSMIVLASYSIIVVLDNILT
ncbi:MAG: hypothetical protein KAS01_01980 [Candidatus Pacebacteria bacterium]|nr:hypothetical protein [Candidatus Paceibacterota bacterium]